MSIAQHYRGSPLVLTHFTEYGIPTVPPSYELHLIYKGTPEAINELSQKMVRNKFYYEASSTGEPMYLIQATGSISLNEWLKI